MSSTEHPARLARLRTALQALPIPSKGAEKLVGMLVPITDPYQSEYPPACYQRLQWLTGFSGSAGSAVVLQDRAAFFTDGRYTLQAAQEVDGALFDHHNSADLRPEQWLVQSASAGAIKGAVAYDPWLHTVAERERWRRALADTGLTLHPLATNPLDALWQDRPPQPQGAVHAHPLTYAGEPSADKRQRLASALPEQSACILTAADSIAWLLNVRGEDVPCNPVVLSYAVLHADGTVVWLVEPARIRPEVAAHVGEGVHIRPPAELAAVLAALPAAQLDPATCPAHIADLLEGAGVPVTHAPDPCLLPKACKNPVEISGARNAHARDGRALTAFLHWLRTVPLKPTEGKTPVTELDVEAKLLELRQAQDLFRQPSFPTIAGFGPNGAIVHYRATEATALPLRAGGILLVDSGGQYLDGTTDVTRTVALGRLEPDLRAEVRDRYTRVLRGHIALARARFPAGTTGSQLDALARQFLWQAGLDYDHGTGHGVGSYLHVHEGPQRISKRGGDVPLRPGMILSNEPGYYKPGAYGIRLENLVLVVEEPPSAEGRTFYRFDTLTLAPFDPSLIDRTMLTAEERDWLDGYHARCEGNIDGMGH